MKKPFVRRLPAPDRECGMTMLLVAVAMVSIIGMAVLSIDVVTLYLAKEEAQRSADAAALAAARVISVSGLTGDPANATGNWGLICGGNSGVATLAAQAVAAQNIVGNQTSATVEVTYSAGTSGTVGTGTTDCTSLYTAATPSAFGVNPLVTVKVTQPGLPNFFSRIWSRSGNTISATATAEAFNPSDSLSSGNQTSGTIIPVQPRCVKPWVVPNQDPLYSLTAPATGSFCNQPTQPACQPFVDSATGAIKNPGISLDGTGTKGVIGERFWLVPDCDKSGNGSPNYCELLTPPQANFSPPLSYTYAQPPANLLSVPGEVGNPVTAVPSCAGDPYEEAIAGCDSPANYQCGVANANAVDLTKHNPGVNSITNAVECLTHQTIDTNITSSSGQDYLQTSGISAPFGVPSKYPFPILAGSSNLLGVSAGTPIMSSNSIVSLPIYDQTQAGLTLASDATTKVTFIGFLQVFINAVDGNGNILVTVLNVTGCGNGTKTTAVNQVQSSSPVPVRLITPP